MKTFQTKFEPFFYFFHSYSEIIYLTVLVLCVGILTALRISGTSAGVYHNYFYGDTTRDEALIFGEPRAIRSDEYTVATAWTVSQTYENYPQINPLYGISGQSFLFYDAPIKDFTMFFKPQNWGFLFFPVEQAIAFKWWFRAALFLFAAFLILLRISKRQAIFSILGSLALFFAPHIQWWYSVTMMDIVTYNLLLFECLIRLIRFQKKIHLIVYASLLAYLSISLILLFYPPTQIIFGWLSVLLAAGFIWQEHITLTRARIKYLLITLASCVIAIAGVMAVFFNRYLPMIKIIQNTIYPGQRVVDGNGFDLTYLLGGFYNIQLQNAHVQIPPVFSSNQSMASGFFLYAIFLIPVLLFISFKDFQKKRQVNFWAVFLSLLFLLFLSWELFGVPPVLGKLLLIDTIPPIRVLLALGILNIVLIAWYLYRVEIPKGRAFFVVSALLSIALALFYLGFGNSLKLNYPGFLLSTRKIVGISILVGSTFFLLVQKKPILFITMLFAFSFISSYRVNPLYQGLGQLNNGSLAETIRRIHNSDPQNMRWVLYDAPIMLNYLQANGIPAINATYYYPDMPLWRMLDPEGQYNEVYNRYARTLFRPDPIKSPRFELTYRDSMSVFIDPCGSQLADLKVKYQVFPYQVHFACLHELRQVNYPAVQFYIYENKNAAR